MCGIAGMVDCGGPESLTRMGAVLRHRGPDAQGSRWFAEAHSGLAHTRLSIIDLSSAANQPLSDARGECWITYNGELYNYRELREALEQRGVRFRSASDTEVVLAAFLEWGAACLDRFNGMFAFAIFDTRSRRLFAARDRLGIKPLYYHQRGTCLLFASEIKALLASGELDPRPDLAALHTPTRFQIEPFTGFEGVFKLPPGHRLDFRDGQLSIHRYWGIEPREDAPDDRAENELAQLLEDAVRQQMVADVPVGVFLSGGLDSSVISALMRGQRDDAIHAFTIRFAEEDQRFERAEDDSYWARRVARSFGLEHHEITVRPDVETLLPRMVWHLDEPLADPASLNTFLIAEAAREHGIVVLLNGMGGDEIFGGYRKHLACLGAEWYQRCVPGPLRRAVASVAQHLPVATSTRGLKSLRWGKRFVSFASLPRTERYLASDLSLNAAQYARLFLEGDYHETHFYRSQRPRFERNGISYLTQMCLNDTEVLLPEHNLLYSDKAAMAAGVESRPPLTDHRIVEFMFSQPPRQRVQGRVQKALLKRVANRYLEQAVVERPKAPFGAPLRAWVRGPLAGMIDDLLAESTLKRRGLHDPAHVARLIREDREGLEDHGHVIWTLLTQELWFRTFFDGAPALAVGGASG